MATSQEVYCRLPLRNKASRRRPRSQLVGVHEQRHNPLSACPAQLCLLPFHRLLLWKRFFARYQAKMRPL